MPTRENCLIRHLLHASVQCYHDDPRYGGAPRWTAPPSRIAGSGGGPDIDLALAGRFEEGIVVAFRGTLPPLDITPDLRKFTLPDGGALSIGGDWLNNLHVTLVRLADEPVAIPGAVHRGFGASLRRLWPGLRQKLDALGAGAGSPRLYFTGHSKGGALANLAALAARHAWNDASVKVATFGAPRAGDEDFARAYQEQGIECRRYEVDGDPVPGSLKVAPAEGSIGLRAMAPVGAPEPRPDVYHFRTSLSLRDVGNIPRPIAAHLPYRSFGYGENVCTDALCRHDWS